MRSNRQKLVAFVFSAILDPFAATIFMSPSFAWDLSDKPFGFRLQITEDRTTNLFPAAHPVTSVNPAGDDFMREPPMSYKALGGLVTEITNLDGHGWVTVFSGIGFFRPLEVGTITGIVGRTDVHDSVTRQGVEFDLNTNATTLRFSYKISPGLALGASVKLAQNHTSTEDAGVEVKSSAVRGEYSLGVMGALGKNWTAGLFLTAAPSWIDTQVSTESDRQRQRLITLLTRLRGGLGWRPVPNLGIYGDIEYLNLNSKIGSADFARVMVMGEMFLNSTLATRLGVTIDSAAQATYTAGIGAYSFKGFNLDLYYSYNAYPEVRHEFGRSNYWLLSLTKMF